MRSDGGVQQPLCLQVEVAGFDVVEDCARPLNSHGVYTLRVRRPTCGASYESERDVWTVRRRFRSFLTLHDIMFDEHEDGGIEPPPKLMRPLLRSNVKQRRNDLTAWIAHHLRHDLKRVAQRVAEESMTGIATKTKNPLLNGTFTNLNLLVANLNLQAFLAPPIVIVHGALASTMLNGVYVRRSTTSFVALSGPASVPQPLQATTPWLSGGRANPNMIGDADECARYRAVGRIVLRRNAMGVFGSRSGTQPLYWMLLPGGSDEPLFVCRSKQTMRAPSVPEATVLSSSDAANIGAAAGDTAKSGKAVRAEDAEVGVEAEVQETRCSSESRLLFLALQASARSAEARAPAEKAKRAAEPEAADPGPVGESRDESGSASGDGAGAGEVEDTFQEGDHVLTALVGVGGVAPCQGRRVSALSSALMEYQRRKEAEDCICGAALQQAVAGVTARADKDGAGVAASSQAMRQRGAGAAAAKALRKTKQRTLKSKSPPKTRLKTTARRKPGTVPKSKKTLAESMKKLKVRAVLAQKGESGSQRHPRVEEDRISVPSEGWRAVRSAGHHLPHIMRFDDCSRALEMQRNGEIATEGYLSDAASFYGSLCSNGSSLNLDHIKERVHCHTQVCVYTVLAMSLPALFMPRGCDEAAARAAAAKVRAKADAKVQATNQRTQPSSTATSAVPPAGVVDASTSAAAGAQELGAARMPAGDGAAPLLHQPGSSTQTKSVAVARAATARAPEEHAARAAVGTSTAGQGAAVARAQSEPLPGLPAHDPARTATGSDAAPLVYDEALMGSAMATLTLAANAAAATASEEARLARSAAAKEAAAVAALAFPSAAAASPNVTEGAQAPRASETAAAADNDAEAGWLSLLRNGVHCKKRSGNAVIKSWLPRFVWVEDPGAESGGFSFCWTKKKVKPESGAAPSAEGKSIRLIEFTSVRAGGATKVELLHAKDSKCDVALLFNTATLAAAWRDALLAAVRMSAASPRR